MRVPLTRIQVDWDLDMNADGVAYAAWADKNPVTAQQRCARVAPRQRGDRAARSPGALQQDPANQSVNDGGNGPDIRVAVDAAGNGTRDVRPDHRPDVRPAARGRHPERNARARRRARACWARTAPTPERQLDLDVAGNGLAWATGNAMYTAGRPRGGRARGGRDRRLARHSRRLPGERERQRRAPGRGAERHRPGPLRERAESEAGRVRRQHRRVRRGHGGSPRDDTARSQRFRGARRGDRRLRDGTRRLDARCRELRRQRARSRFVGASGTAPRSRTRPSWRRTRRPRSR